MATNWSYPGAPIPLAMATDEILAVYTSLAISYWSTPHTHTPLAMATDQILAVLFHGNRKRIKSLTHIPLAMITDTSLAITNWTIPALLLHQRWQLKKKSLRYLLYWQLSIDQISDSHSTKWQLIKSTSLEITKWSNPCFPSPIATTNGQTTSIPIAATSEKYVPQTALNKHSSTV